MRRSCSRSPAACSRPVQQLGDASSPELAAQLREVITPLAAVAAATAPADVGAAPKPLDELRRDANKARGHLESVRTGILAAHKRLARAETQLVEARGHLASKEALFAPAEEEAASSEAACRTHGENPVLAQPWLIHFHIFIQFQ